MRQSPGTGRIVGRLLAALCALAIAALALAGLAQRTLGARTDTARAERLADLASLAQLAAQERRLLVARRPDGAVLLRIRRLVGRLSLSAPAHLNDVVMPTASALGLAAGRKRGRVVTAFSHVGKAAQAALDDEATAAPATRTTNRLEDAAAALAALACAAFGLGVARSRRRPSAAPDARVEELAAEARTDSLTGLGNHRAFLEALDAAIAERTATGAPFVLLAMDLDSLKQVNDRDGHLAGDRHIKLIAECLRRVVGTRGSVHRTGGDEFVAILPACRNWHGLGVARRIDEETRRLVGRRALSIGLTESTSTEGRHLLVGQADLALYEAKRTRLNAVVFNPGLAKPANEPADDASRGPAPEQRALAAALARAVDAKDVGTQSHCETVAELCAAIGRRLGVDGNHLERLRIAGLLHDVGKIGVADAILQKPHGLDEGERQEMTRHVELGHSILLAAELPTEAEWVLYHHEHFDGRGYPAKKRAGEIPLEARIIAVADAFEAMTADRPYRASCSTAEAVDELRMQAGSQFDGRCVEALVEVISEAAQEADDAPLFAHNARTWFAASEPGSRVSTRAALRARSA